MSQTLCKQLILNLFLQQKALQVLYKQIQNLWKFQSGSFNINATGKNAKINIPIKTLGSFIPLFDIFLKQLLNI